MKVNCDRHGASIGGGEDTAKTVSVSFTKDYQDFVKANPKTSNDNLRKAFLKKYDGKWPTLTVSGETYSIQPYYQDRGTSKQVEDRVWLFAKKESVSGWNTNYIYNPKNGQWYGATTWKGERAVLAASFTRISMISLIKSTMKPTPTERKNGLS